VQPSDLSSVCTLGQDTLATSHKEHYVDFVQGTTGLSPD
jgi:hypothetical protein